MQPEEMNERLYIFFTLKLSALFQLSRGVYTNIIQNVLVEVGVIPNIAQNKNITWDAIKKVETFT